MLTSPPPKKGARTLSANAGAADGSHELKLISDLGRSLLSAVHPKRVAMRVAEAIRERLDARACVFAAELDNIGLISCAVTADGEAEDAYLRRERFERWLALLPPQIGYGERDEAEFLIEGDDHRAEYVSPLHLNGDIRGAIAIGFDEERELTEPEVRFVEAATQMAAMSVNLTAHFETTLNHTVNEAREEHRRFTEAVLDALPLSLYVVDRDFRIVMWNRQREIGEQGIPRDTALGRNVFEVLEKYPQGRVRGEFERAFRTGRIERVEQQTVAEDGSPRYWTVSKVPMRDPDSRDVTHVISIGEDVTMRVEAVQAISRAEKLAAVGRLAAGIVHEINNPLATIAACAEALEGRIDEGSFDASDAKADLTEYLGLVKSEAFRCKNITTDLLDFSRIRTGERSPTDPGDIVRSAANLVSHQKRGHGITHHVQIDEELPMVSADAGQIQQAVIALATNGIDAMPDGGELTFRAFAKGDRVVIEVQDTGAGIPQANMSKIFEPFFTTKEVGRGTGLGLAVCYGIISEHGGRLSVRSKVGKGSTFSIFLPASGV